MKYLIALGFFLFTISCESIVLARPKAERRLTLDEVRASIEKTVRDRISDCGDVICEGDLDPESVIESTGQAIIWDLEVLYARQK